MVVPLELGVAADLGGRDAGGVPVEAADAEVEVALVPENADLGCLAGRRPLLRLALGERADRRRPAHAASSRRPSSFDGPSASATRATALGEASAPQADAAGPPASSARRHPEGARPRRRPRDPPIPQPEGPLDRGRRALAVLPADVAVGHEAQRARVHGGREDPGRAQGGDDVRRGAALERRDHDVRLDGGDAHALPPSERLGQQPRVRVVVGEARDEGVEGDEGRPRRGRRPAASRRRGACAPVAPPRCARATRRGPTRPARRGPSRSTPSRCPRPSPAPPAARRGRPPRSRSAPRPRARGSRTRAPPRPRPAPRRPSAPCPRRGCACSRGRRGSRPTCSRPGARPRRARARGRGARPARRPSAA